MRVLITPNAEFTGAPLLRVRWNDVLCVYFQKLGCFAFY